MCRQMHEVLLLMPEALQQALLWWDFKQERQSCDTTEMQCNTCSLAAGVSGFVRKMAVLRETVVGKQLRRRYS